MVRGQCEGESYEKKKKKKDSKLFVKVVAPIKKYYVKIVKKNGGVSIGAERGGGGEGVGA